MSASARIAVQIRRQFASEGSGHDWLHIQRVLQLARRLALAEGARLEVVELGALVHDIADWKFNDGDDAVGPARARALLEREGVGPELTGEVVDIVATISYKGAGVPTPMRTLEGQCVQDADRLDAMGAVGIARCFAYGGHAGRLMYDPEVAPVLHQTGSAYKAARGTSLNHFYEKLLLLKDRMNTPSGLSLAQERHRYMVEYVDRFLAEGEGRL